MIERRLKRISKRGGDYLFDIDTYDIFNVSHSTQKFHQEFEEFRELWSQDDCESVVSSKRKLPKATLCVSNDCNLRCKYCFAHGGDYGMKRTIMNQDTADQFIEFCVNNYDGVNKIMFFGGEPLLNYKIIKYICCKFQQLALSERFPLPVFCMVTNGTLMSSEIEQLLKEHINHVTISIDGPKYINDKNRIFKNGKGSFNKIDNFIKVCKNIPNLSIYYEATYTADHISYGLSMADIKQYMRNSYGIEGLVIEEQSLEGAGVINQLQAITKTSLLEDDFENLPMGFWETVKVLISRQKHAFCEVLAEKLTVSADGRVFGCHMLQESSKNSVGEISDPNLSSKISNSVPNFKNNHVCRQCWSFKLCGGCPISKFYANGKVFSEIPDNIDCNLTREFIEETLALFLMIYEDKQLKPLFIKKAQFKFT